MKKLEEFLKRQWPTILSTILIPMLTALGAWLWQTAAYNSYITDGDKHMKHHNFRGAEKNYREALRCVPFYINWRNIDAIIHPGDKLDSLSTSFFKTFATDPYKEMIAHFKLATALKNEGNDFLQTSSEFQQALSIANERYSQLTKEVGLGELEFIDLSEKRGQYEDALEQYNKFLMKRIGPALAAPQDSRDILFLKFTCLHRIGRIELLTEQDEQKRIRLASEAFTAARAIQPKVILSDKDSQELLAVFLVDVAGLEKAKGNRSEAEKCYQDVDNLYNNVIGLDYPEYPTYLLSHADFLMTSKAPSDVQKAEALLVKATNLVETPNMKAQALRRLFNLYALNKNDEKAQVLSRRLDSLIDSDQKNLNALTIGTYLIDKAKYLVTKGNYEQAKELIAKAYAESPSWELPKPPVIPGEEPSVGEGVNPPQVAVVQSNVVQPIEMVWDLTKLPAARQRDGILDRVRQITIYVKNRSDSRIAVIMDSDREKVDVDAGQIGVLSEANLGDAPTIRFKNSEGKFVGEHKLGIQTNSKVYLNWTGTSLTQQML